MPQAQTLPVKLTYVQAKSWARSQDPLINGVSGWKALRKARLLPPGMPAWPQGAYKEEFESWGEFLGTGTLAAMRRNFKPYAKARVWARRQQPRITSKTQWYAMVKSQGVPADIPTDPRSHYGEKFEGWGKFLGTGLIANQCRQMLSYEELKRWARRQSPVIHSREDYLARLRKSTRQDLPTAPDRKYAKKFEGWPKFLGVDRAASTSMAERRLKAELSSFLPVDQKMTTRLNSGHGRRIQVDIHIPDWNLVIEFDGSYFHKDKEGVDRSKTTALYQANPGLRVIRVREQPLKALSDDDVVVESNLDPLFLAQAVVRHMLDKGLIRTGFGRAARGYLRRKTPAGEAVVGARWRSYDKAREWARKQGLKTVLEWREKSKQEGFLPDDIPAAPPTVYREDFKGWSDFLGVRIVASHLRKFWPYEKAQAWAARRGIKTGKAWVALSVAGRLPKSLPSNPNATYKEHWRGWGHFLGVAKPKDEPWAGLEEIARWCAAQSPPVKSLRGWSQVKDVPDFPKHFPKSLEYRFGAGVFGRIRRPHSPPPTAAANRVASPNSR